MLYYRLSDKVGQLAKFLNFVMWHNDSVQLIKFSDETMPNIFTIDFIDIFIKPSDPVWIIIENI